MSLEFLNCSYTSVCSGCDWLLKPMGEQHGLKTADLRAHLGQQWAPSKPIQIRSPRPGGMRDRVDLMIDRRTTGHYRLGLFDRFKTGIVDLQGCPQLSPALEDWLKDFRRIEFPIERGSVRLRVAPNGTRGAWLDFANIDVKNLMTERTSLEVLMHTGAVVEIGQRRKRLVFRDGRFRLDEAQLEPWFETYIDQRAVPLYAAIGSFTQPGFQANRILIEETMRLIKSTHLPQTARVAEFGSGIGNFTLPLSAAFSQLDAYEVDRLALEGLTRSLTEQGIGHVYIHSGNYQGHQALSLDFANVDLILVDPPRSGLMNFLMPIAKAKPRALVYVSCFAESFASDSAQLLEAGYLLDEIVIIDQFPQTRHYETVALFRCQ